MASTPGTTAPAAPTWQDRAVLAWPLALALVLCLPLYLRAGHPLARDLVFVPRQPFTDATWGLGDVAPRAVPLDAVVATLTHVVDGGVLARVVLPVTLALLGWGVARLVVPLGRTAQLAASGFAVWNAYVVERLALGQWALLLGCAALPWLGGRRDALPGRGPTRRPAGCRVDRGGRADAGRRRLLAVAGLAVACLPHLRRTTAAVAAGVLLQLPWVVAAVTGPAGSTSDASGVAVFAPDTESRFGPVVALLGLGGIWDRASEPATRATAVALVAAVVVVVVLAVGVPLLVRAWGPGDAVRWVVLSAVLGGTALLAATPWGQSGLVGLVDTVPGAGLLRDTQKLLAPVVVLASAAFGACAARLVALLGRVEGAWAGVVVVALLPVLLLPDATVRTWATVAPVRLPDDLGRAAEVLDGTPGVVVTLPWRAYRSFDWAHGGVLTSSDPATRMVDADVVTSDSLQVGPVLVPGESPLAAEIGAALAQGPPAAVLPDLGVTRVVLYPDDPDAATVDTSGLEPVLRTPVVEVFRVPGAEPAARAGTTVRRLAVLGAHAVALGVLLVAIGVLLAGAVRRRRPRGGDRRKSARGVRDADPPVMYPDAR
ncbi:hypothetical protein [Nocardioides okcheonensis]|uniref:hypothetical protein n=1 Tax=Nocardioides okcheonensis TaxID=2894081 RepID=UPI001E3C4190|nr:hypothetical protein [Nocardioides okcheonensis]UFN44855.1 hypothetical protein LN652_01135 [Nocardioides okcheonensis]